MKARWKFLAVAATAALLGILTTSGSKRSVLESTVAEAPMTDSTGLRDAGVSEAAPEPEEPEWRILGEYTTHFKAPADFKKGDGRRHNITKLSVALNFVIEPGDVWSFNESLGPRTKERGYLPAATIVLGEMTESYGGGTCQVSSTAFVAALRAGLEIVERRPHSRPSGYIPRGMDATVSYPEECLVDKPDPRICPDLKIKNPYDFPVSIKGLDGWSSETPDGHESIKVAILGPGEPPKVETKWRTWKTVEPEKRFRKVLRKGSKRFRKQRSAPGVEGVLIVTTNGQESRFISRYKPVDEVWYVPVDWEEETDAGYPEEP